MLLGTVVAIGAGVMAFRYGMKAQKLSGDGKNASEITSTLIGDTANSIKKGYDWCAGTVGKITGNSGKQE